MQSQAIESGDLRAVCQKMASSFLARPEVMNREKPARIAFLSVDYRAREYFDTQMFLEKIRTLLIQFGQGKLQFLDRAHTEEILKEREAKRRGEIDATVLANRYGADLFLTGVITDISRQEGSAGTVYTRYAFRLVDAETEAIVWEDEYEEKRLTTTPTWKQ